MSLPRDRPILNNPLTLKILMLSVASYLLIAATLFAAIFFQVSRMFPSDDKNTARQNHILIASSVAGLLLSAACGFFIKIEPVASGNQPTTQRETLAYKTLGVITLSVMLAVFVNMILCGFLPNYKGCRISGIASLILSATSSIAGCIKIIP